MDARPLLIALCVGAGCSLSLDFDRDYPGETGGGGEAGFEDAGGDPVGGEDGSGGDGGDGGGGRPEDLESQCEAVCEAVDSCLEASESCASWRNLSDDFVDGYVTFCTSECTSGGWSTKDPFETFTDARICYDLVRALSEDTGLQFFCTLEQTCRSSCQQGRWPFDGCEAPADPEAPPSCVEQCLDQPFGFWACVDQANSRPGPKPEPCSVYTECQVAEGIP
jgi:hypothetical protein